MKVTIDDQGSGEPIGGGKEKLSSESVEAIVEAQGMIHEAMWRLLDVPPDYLPDLTLMRLNDLRIELKQVASWRS